MGTAPPTTSKRAAAPTAPYQAAWPNAGLRPGERDP